MYSKFFENGLTEEALDRACDHALNKIEEKVSFLVGAQIYALWYDNIKIVVEVDNSKLEKFFKNSRTIPAYPTKVDSYDAERWVKDWISDEAGQWQPTIPFGNKPVNFSDKEIAMAMAFRTGIDPYKEEE